MVGICADRPIPAVLEFDAQLQILELLDHKVCSYLRRRSWTGCGADEMQPRRSQIRCS